MATRGINIPLDMGAVIVDMAGKSGNNTEGEDSPSSPSPAVISQIRNVLPTANGYKSAFSPVYPLPKTGEVYPQWVLWEEWHPSHEVANMLKTAMIQRVLPWDTGSQELIFVLLTEGGVFLYYPAGEDYIEEPGRLLEYSMAHLVSPDNEKFNLWTYAILDNRLYLYRQGMDYLLILGDSTLASDAENWQLDDVEVVLDKEVHLLQMIKATPKFLNMEGQIGIFKAGNRLGFWDSDNAIAWSSAFNKLDFTPDVVSMAGITKFADVSGDIVTILPTSEGFIVYSKGAIVRVDPLNGEERWAASALLRDGGISFYTQATTGSDPEYHVAWTSNGLYEISGKQVKPLISEEFRHLSGQRNEHGEPVLYMITLIGMEYLLISQAQYWDAYPADNFVRVGKLPGSDKDYHFYLPNLDFEVGYEPGWLDVIKGTLPDWVPQVLNPDEWELTENPLPPSTDFKPLIPFYTGWRYQTPDILRTVGFPTWEIDESDAGPMPNFISGAYPAVNFQREDNVLLHMGGGNCEEFPTKVPTTTGLPKQEPQWLIPDWFYGNDTIDVDYPRRFIDAAGQEFVDILQDSMTKFYQDQNTYWDEADGIQILPPLLDTRHECTFPDGELIERARNGWRIKGLSLSQHTRELEEGEELTDLLDINRLRTIDPPEIEEGETPAPPEYLTESEYEYLRQFLYGDNLLTPNIHRQFSPQVARNAPWIGIAPRVVADSCGIHIYAFIDDLAGCALRFMEVNTIAEAQHYVGPGLGDDGSDYVKVFNATISEEHSLGMTLKQYSFYGSQTYEVFPASFIGKSREEINALVRPTDEEIRNLPQWKPIFVAELSGLGYEERISSTWTRYIKTISRARLWVQDPDNGCTPKGDSLSWDYSDPEIPDNLFGDMFQDSWNSSPDFNGAPPSYTLPDMGGFPDYDNNFVWPYDVHYAARFRKGTEAPYYPAYEKAWVLDRTLGKWGSLDLGHSVVFSTVPDNSASSIVDLKSPSFELNDPRRFMPFGIIPKYKIPAINRGEAYEAWYNASEGFREYRAESYGLMYQLPVMLSDSGHAGQLVFTSVAMTRDGYTKMTGLSGAKLGDGVVEIRGSWHGQEFGVEAGEWTPERTRFGLNIETNTVSVVYGDYWGTMHPLMDFRIPFVLVGKEFQIAVAGHFRLHKLICYGQPTGNLKFFGENEYIPPE